MAHNVDIELAHVEVDHDGEKMLDRTEVDPDVEQRLGHVEVGHGV